MRPINKGVSTATYATHGDARHDLAAVIGYYCSYCEMAVKNMIEVEHVHPVNNGGNSLAWDNFLLSCKYCNTVKSDNNPDRLGYLWPDIDNTDLAFEYSESKVIEPKMGLNPTIQASAQASINLMGLDRIPNGINDPTEADTRWRSRAEAWDNAKLSYCDWKEAPTIQLARSIARNSCATGHYSIWREVFKNEPQILNEIDSIYFSKGLYKQYALNGNRYMRLSGVI